MARFQTSYQARGLERRERLLAACRTLLDTVQVGQFGLAEVAEAAKVPKSSVYHFFPRIDDLLAALASEVAGELLAALTPSLEGEFTHWRDVLAVFVARGRDFYAASTPALKLQLGPYTPPEIKNRDRNNDLDVAAALRRHIESAFALPDLPDLDGAFFRAIEIADLMFMLSVREHGTLTGFYAEEAIRASAAYLELYIPRHLPRR